MEKVVLFVLLFIVLASCSYAASPAASNSTGVVHPEHGSCSTYHTVVVQNACESEIQVTCAAKDTDLGGSHDLLDQASFAWSFEQKITCRTLFYCNATWGSKHFHWDAYSGCDCDSFYKLWYIQADGFHRWEKKCSSETNCWLEEKENRGQWEG